MDQTPTGLTQAEAKRKLAAIGPNLIFTPYTVNFWGIFKEEVTEPMILLLLVVGFFYSIWGKLEDAITIFIVIILLTFSEVINEFRAKRAISSLEKIAEPKTKVIRDGHIRQIDSLNIVPGDILVLTGGTKISADSRVIRSVNLQVDESALTGESHPKGKPLDSQISAGTVVVFGEGLAEVMLTGRNTKIGQLAESAKMIKPPKTKLQLAMKSLAGKLVYVALFFSISIPLLGVIRGQPLKQMILTGLSLSFAVIPEELPIVITMVLAVGSYTLSKKNFLVKKLKAAETLGSATVIVTDKTGTLTEGKMKLADTFPAKQKEVLAHALNGLSDLSLDPLDKAIKKKSADLGIISQKDSPILRERSFGDGRKTRSLLRSINDRLELTVSGAPEEVFAMCGHLPKEAMLKLTQETEKGRRVIALAGKRVVNTYKDRPFSELEKGLEFLGLLSFEDPPRAGVKETIAKAKKAGIRTIMVTGDHPATAGYIAKEIGIPADKIMTGDDLKKLSSAELKEMVKKIDVFARATPEDKYKIVKALQENSQIVAVTGDGINDALALKGADIGIAMGIRGTDVAKEAAQVVLADDNYVTITNGIFEGRKFFDNLQKGIKYYLSVKAALVSIFLLPVLVGVPMPLSPIQIITLELFMDLAASVGFVSEPKEENIYRRKPRNPKENILNNHQIADVLLKGASLFASVSLVYFYSLHLGLGQIFAQTMAFSTWIFGHIFLAFVSRSDRDTISTLGYLTNKMMLLWAIAAFTFLFLAVYSPLINSHFGLMQIPPIDMVMAALVAAILIGLQELRKTLHIFPAEKLA